MSRHDETRSFQSPYVYGDLVRRLQSVFFGIALVALSVVALSPAHHTQVRGQSDLQSLLSGGVDLPFDPALAAASCPYERGPVKEGSDSTRFKVATTVVSTTVNYLRGRAKPSSYPRTTRVGGAELHTYQVHAYLTQYKIEADGDIHLVLKDASGRSMIAEIPLGSCVPSASRWKSSIATARLRFVSTLHATSSWHYLHRAITLRGIGYFDPPHGQTGAAKNGLELHPVIGVSFTSASPGGTASAPTTTASAPTPTPVTTTGTCGAPSNPYGYNFCSSGSLIYNPASGVCSYFDCIASFWNGSGYMAECSDGTFSMSGGNSGACSTHGGVWRPVYSGTGPH